MSNVITSVGVLLILIAFCGNVSGNLNKGYTYFVLNLIGSILAGIGAFMVQLWPIVLLEAIWAIVSIYEILKLKSNK